ncbi:Ig-like domain-containing protein [Candidatus Palauibacter sp.]|uniref:Ig-like domain-containing protein n=1 Tax=Candidatus Palauibacter sp. TaxID=3101350 RepID=UPI003AF204D1
MPDVELPVGEAAVIDAARHFSDPDGDPLAIAAESSDTSVASAGVAGDSVSVRAIAPGMATITVTATDPGGLAATQAFAITVPNRPPHATDPLPHIELRVGDEAAADLSTHFADPDGQPLAFTAESSDGAVAAVAVSGQEMTLIAIASGAASITVTATDPGGLTAMQTFSATVPNRAPVRAGAMPDVELPVGEAAVIDAARHFSDPDGDPLAFTAESSDTSVASAGIAGDSVSVRAIAPGMATITVTATDPGGLAATQAFAITVPNRPPHATDPLPHIELRVGDEAAADLSTHFADPDGQPLAFTAESSDGAVAAVAVSGQEMTLIAIASGAASITVTATDPGGLTAMQTFSVTVPNRAPVRAGAMPDVELPVGEAAVIDAARHFSDPDGDPLAFTAESSDTSVASAGVAGDSVSVRAIAPGMATITVTATDPGGLAATQAFAITVPNRPPHATDPLPHIELRVGDEAAADLSTHFADPDGQPLAFTAESSDGAVAAVAVSGQEMTLIAIASGMATITVTATDPGGLTAMQTFSVTVPNRAPVRAGAMPDVELPVGEAAVIDAARHFSDPDGDPLTFTAESSDTSVASAGIAGDSVSVRAIAPGMATITVDRAGLRDRPEPGADLPHIDPRRSSVSPCLHRRTAWRPSGRADSHRERRGAITVTATDLTAADVLRLSPTARP